MRKWNSKTLNKLLFYPICINAHQNVNEKNTSEQCSENYWIKLTQQEKNSKDDIEVLPLSAW